MFLYGIYELVATKEDKMKYTKQFFKDLVKKHNMTMTDLGKALEVSMSTLYRYVKWDENASHSKRELTEKKKFDKKLSKFIEGKKGKKGTNETKPIEIVSGKYIAVPVNSAEEICYQLSQGIEVFQEGSNDSLKLVEGIIVRFRGNNPVFINCAISLDEKYYIKVPKPIIVEVGKRYLTRDNKEAVVFVGGENYKAATIGTGIGFVVDKNGKNIGGNSEYDLVEQIND